MKTNERCKLLLVTNDRKFLDGLFAYIRMQSTEDEHFYMGCIRDWEVEELLENNMLEIVVESNEKEYSPKT